MRRTFELDLHGQALHRTDCTERTTYQPGPVPRWTESTRFWKGKYRQSSLHERYIALSESASHIVFAWKKDASLQLRIEYRKMNAVIVKDAYQSFEWTSVGLVRRSAHIFNVRRQLWLLANPSRRSAQGQNVDEVEPRTLQIFKNAIWSEERPKHVPTHNGRYNINCQAAVCAHIPGRCRHFVEAC